MQHLVSSCDLSLTDIYNIFRLAYKYQTSGMDVLKDDKFSNKLALLLFDEPSSRTKLSFIRALTKLGVATEIITDLSSLSLSKGETIADTARLFNVYTDLVVVRSKDRDFIKRLQQLCYTTHVINAGNGDDEHPTQALLDLYTILQYYSSQSILDVMGKKTRMLKDCKIAFVGDIKHSRTIRSLLHILRNFKLVDQFIFAAKPELHYDNYFSNDIVYDLNDESLEIISKQCDIIYLTRLQKERFDSGLKVDEAVFDYYKFGMTSSKNFILMHPLPRGEELPRLWDADPRSKYFEQVANGVFVRMGLVATLLKGGTV